MQGEVDSTPTYLAAILVISDLTFDVLTDATDVYNKQMSLILMKVTL